MAFDYSKLRTYLANSKIQTQNNALFQTISNLIDGVQDFFTQTNTSLDELNTTVNSLGTTTGIFTVEADTSTTGPSYSLSDYVTPQRGYVIFKDISGNASVNNITLVGTVEGVTDPTITTNYGIYRVFLSSDGDFLQW